MHDVPPPGPALTRRLGTLFIVATPIGNLEDASPRVASTLAACALVLCEDTRRTGRLLQALHVEARLLSCHEHDEARRVPIVLERLAAGEDVALVSDAGTPCIADPGYRLVSAAAAAGSRIVPIPGPSAVIAALSVSGLPTDAFVFEGFLPRKPVARRRVLAALADEPRTLVLLETPHRLHSALADLVATFGPTRRAFAGRELTKLHEEGIRGTLADLAERFGERADARGEVTLVIAGAPPRTATGAPGDAIALVEQLVAEGLDEREALRRAARELGLSRREVYHAVKVAERDEPADDAEDE